MGVQRPRVIIMNRIKTDLRVLEIGVEVTALCYLS
jgi:hypothetical protein